MNILRSFAIDGKTVILITHNREDAKATDEIITIMDGRVIKGEDKGQVDS
jgi:ABC-type lipoprotein export system ATPase subunit